MINETADASGTRSTSRQVRGSNPAAEWPGARSLARGIESAKFLKRSLPVKITRYRETTGDGGRTERVTWRGVHDGWPHHWNGAGIVGFCLVAAPGVVPDLLSLLIEAVGCSKSSRKRSSQERPHLGEEGRTLGDDAFRRYFRAHAVTRLNSVFPSRDCSTDIASPAVAHTSSVAAVAVRAPAAAGPCRGSPAMS